MWHDSFIQLTDSISILEKIHSYTHTHMTSLHTHMTWLFHVCDIFQLKILVPRKKVGGRSWWNTRRNTRSIHTHMTWLFHVCDIFQAYLWQDLFVYIYIDIYIYRYIYVSDMTRSYMWHIPSISMTWSIHIHSTWLLYVWDIFRPYRSRRRSDFKYLNIQIGRFSRPPFGMTGTSVYFREHLFEILGLPWKPIWKLRGKPIWKLRENLFESYVKSCLKFLQL